MVAFPCRCHANESEKGRDDQGFSPQEFRSGNGGGAASNLFDSPAAESGGDLYGAHGRMRPGIYRATEKSAELIEAEILEGTLCVGLFPRISGNSGPRFGFRMRVGPFGLLAGLAGNVRHGG